MDNIEGVFPVKIGDKEYETKCTFGVTEKLERTWQKPIAEEIAFLLQKEAAMIGNLVDALLLGLLESGVTEFSRDELGQIVLRQGSHEFHLWYLNFLHYGLTGKPFEFVLDDAGGDDTKKK